MITFFSRRGFFGKRWYFNIKAPNGEILCQSEAYNSKAARDNGFQSLCRNVLAHRHSIKYEDHL